MISLGFFTIGERGLHRKRGMTSQRETEYSVRGKVRFSSPKSIRSGKAALLEIGKAGETVPMVTCIGNKK